jgi:molybdenum cofactor biosynthesis enzyme MoaA
VKVNSHRSVSLLKRLGKSLGAEKVLLNADITLGLLSHSIAHVLPGIIQPQPRNITIAITAYCNLRCIGCRYGRDFMPGAHLSWPMLRDLLDDAQRGGFQSVRLYGGEPLLHPDLPRVASHALGLGMSTYVTTNGILLGEKIDELYAAGLRNFTIGFYGVGDHYDVYVQRKDRFNRLRESLDRVRRRYGMGVSLQMNWLLMRPSCDLEAIKEAWRFAEEYKMQIQVDLIHYSLPYFSEGPGRCLQFRAEDRPAIERLVAELIRLKRRHPEMLKHSEMGLASIPDWLIKGPDMRIPCDKYQMLWVGADGTVQLCYVTFKLGNLHEKRLSEMLFQPEHKRAARDAYAVRCPNCHCGYDQRVQKDLSARRKYSAGLVTTTGPAVLLPHPAGGTTLP